MPSQPGPETGFKKRQRNTRWPWGHPPMPHSHPPTTRQPTSSQPRPARQPGGGVPLSLWPHLPEPPGAAAPDCAACAWAVITSFSGEGDLVVIPDARTHVVLAAAALARRRALGLCGPAWAEVTDALGRDLPLTYRLLATARTGTTSYLLHPACREAGRAALAVTTPSGGPGDADIYAACERALRPGGVLAVITTSPVTAGRLRDVPGEVTTRARAAGLVYLQHIAAIHAHLDGGHLTPAPGTPPAQPGTAHARAHSDVLVFTKPGGGTPR